MTTSYQPPPMYLPCQSSRRLGKNSRTLNGSIQSSLMVSDVDMNSEDLPLAEEYKASDKTIDVTSFVRTETVEFFDNYITLNTDGIFTYANPTAYIFLIERMAN